MARIALVTVSDGRTSVYSEIRDFASGAQERVANALRHIGHEVAVVADPVGSNREAVDAGRQLAATSPDLTLVNIPVWAFPHFTVLIAGETRGPLALFSNVDPKYPGMVGMLAAGGALDQLGRPHLRAWGDVADESVVARLDGLARAASAVSQLRGSTFGRVGGRPMGMYTAVSSSDQWMTQFGIDVEEIDQFELVRRAEAADPVEARRGRTWLEERVAGVHYDGVRLTPELLERQLRVYMAMRDLIEERNLDFCGIKGQPELTDHYCTMDVAEALLNDPYDWNGARAPVVCSTEADMDGALTMEVLMSLSGTPVLFADLRCHHADLDVWDLCNSGQHATWFANRSDTPEDNLAGVSLFPEEFYFPAGGASVHHLASPGEMTFARFSRLDGKYRLQAMKGRFVRYDDETNERLMRASTYVWPHAFAEFDARSDAVLARYGSNHIHAVPGDCLGELELVCQLLDADFEDLGA